MSHRILVMRHGKMVELGTADQIINQPQTEYAQTLNEPHLNLFELGYTKL